MIVYLNSCPKPKLSLTTFPIPHIPPSLLLLLKRLWTWKTISKCPLSKKHSARELTSEKLTEDKNFATCKEIYHNLKIEKWPKQRCWCFHAEASLAHFNGFLMSRQEEWVCRPKKKPAQHDCYPPDKRYGIDYSLKNAPKTAYRIGSVLKMEAL